MTISNLEREAVSKAISSGIRLDGRSFENHREITFEFSSINRGNVSVSLGRTRYVVIIINFHNIFFKCSSNSVCDS